MPDAKRALLGCVAVCSALSCAEDRNRALRNASAGFVGCEEQDIQVYHIRRHGGSTTWAAACHGKHYMCTLVRGEAFEWTGSFGDAATQIHCTPANEREKRENQGDQKQQRAEAPAPAQAAPTTTPRPVAPPVGAGGFRFGQSPPDVQSACSTAGGAIQELEANRVRCSKLPEDIGIEAQADLTFCSGTVCDIELLANPGNDAQQARVVYASFGAALTRKYGSPKANRKEGPGECEGSEAFSRCLQEGRATALQGWIWSGGARILLKLERDNESLLLRIKYVAGRQTNQPRGNAL
jgi:hypothetical protein